MHENDLRYNIGAILDKHVSKVIKVQISACFFLHLSHVMRKLAFTVNMKTKWAGASENQHFGFRSGPTQTGLYGHRK